MGGRPRLLTPGRGAPGGSPGLRWAHLDDQGCGVGGGSLGYANTLYRPRPAFYTDSQWDGLADWEVELGIVIGKRASYIGEDEAMDHIAGFCLANDVSEREFQLERGGNWMKGKSAPTFGPLGPWLVTPDEVGDVQDLGMWLDVNGARMQTGSTKTMIFHVKKIVSYISHFMTLEVGDVIVTGTPPGVGSGKKPPVFLKAGDTMRLGIDKLGEQACRVVAWEG